MELSNLYKYYFDFAYYLCLCPFRFISKSGRIPSQSKFTLKSHRFQRALCFLTFLLASWVALLELKEALPTPRNRKRPSSYFRFAASFTYFLKQSMIYKSFWTKPDAYLDLINYLSSPSFKADFSRTNKSATNSSLVVRKIWRKSIVISFCLPYTLASFSRIFDNELGMFPTTSEEWSIHFQQYWGGMAKLACDNLYWSYSTRPSDFSCDSPNWRKNLVTALAVPVTIGIHHRSLNTWIGFLLMLNSSLVLWLAVKAFAQSIVLENSANLDLEEPKNEKILPKNKVANVWNTPQLGRISRIELKWERIWGQLKSLHMLTNKITEVNGDIVFWTTIMTTIKYSLTLNTVFTDDTSNWFGMIRYFGKVGSTCAIFLIPADICFKVGRKSEI